MVAKRPYFPQLSFDDGIHYRNEDLCLYWYQRGSSGKYQDKQIVALCLERKWEHLLEAVLKNVDLEYEEYFLHFDGNYRHLFIRAAKQRYAGRMYYDVSGLDKVELITRLWSILRNSKNGEEDEFVPHCFSDKERKRMENATFNIYVAGAVIPWSKDPKRYAGFWVDVWKNKIGTFDQLFKEMSKS